MITLHLCVQWTFWFDQFKWTVQVRVEIWIWVFEIHFFVRNIICDQIRWFFLFLWDNKLVLILNVIWNRICRYNLNWRELDWKRIRFIDQLYSCHVNRSGTIMNIFAKGVNFSLDDIAFSSKIIYLKTTKCGIPEFRKIYVLRKFWFSMEEVAENE